MQIYVLQFSRQIVAATSDNRNINTFQIQFIIIALAKNKRKYATYIHLYKIIKHIIVVKYEKQTKIIKVKMKMEY